MAIGKVQSNLPTEAAKILCARHLTTIGGHFQFRALVRQVGQSTATTLYDWSH